MPDPTTDPTTTTTAAPAAPATADAAKAAPKKGAYTSANRRCSTKDCDHFVANHSPNTPADDDDTRGECMVGACGCKSYTDDPDRAEE